MPQSVNWGKRPTKQREGREKLLDRLDGFVDPNYKTKRLNAVIPAELITRLLTFSHKHDHYRPYPFASTAPTNWS